MQQIFEEIQEINADPKACVQRCWEVQALMTRFSCQTVFVARIQPEEIAELPPNMAPACTRSTFLAASTAAMQPAAPPPADVKRHKN